MSQKSSERKALASHVISALELCDERDRLRGLLERYMNAYPAFRIKPVGAPGSEARIEQENLMALENEARFAIHGCQHCEGTQRVNTELGTIKCPMCANRRAP